MSFFITLINPDPDEITLKAGKNGDLFSFYALWHKTQQVGQIVGIRNDDGDFQISDLSVKDDVLITRTPILPFEKRANFRGRGIGKKLLHEFVAYAKRAGAKSIYGSVVSGDIEANADLLDWYHREGFTIREPDERCLRDAVIMIEMIPGPDA